MLIYTCVGEWKNPGIIHRHLKELIYYLEDDIPEVSFWVGNHTDLEKEFLSVLREVKLEYPKLSYGLVLSSLDEAVLLDGEEYIYPEQLAKEEGDPLEIRNQWLLDNARLFIYPTFDRDESLETLLREAEDMGKEMFDLVDFCVR